MSEAIIEPLLSPHDNRFVLFPIKDQEIWNMYENQVELFWRPQEIDFSKDTQDWHTLNANEQYFIKMILSFFASSDGIIMENLALRFMGEVQLAEARSFYSFQMMMENIHSHTYSLLIETYIKKEEEKNKLFNAIQHFPCIKQKSDWARKWISDDTTNFATRLVAFACVEGIFFSGAFCSIYWLKKRGLMPGLTFSNELIARDEGLHTDFAVLLYKKLINKISVEKIMEIVKETVKIETNFIVEALPCKLIGMNSDMMVKYIQFVADRLIVQLGYSKIYGTENPFPFMELISLESKTNFFEKRNAVYALANKEKSDDIFELDDESF